MINTPLYPATLPPKLLLYLLITEVKYGKLMFIQSVYGVISHTLRYNTIHNSLHLFCYKTLKLCIAKIKYITLYTKIIKHSFTHTHSSSSTQHTWEKSRAQSNAEVAANNFPSQHF